MSKRRMTKLRLLADLRKLLARPDTRIIEKKLRTECGKSEWMEEDDGRITNIIIHFDPRRDGRVRLIIHELLHAWMSMHLEIQSRMVYELEEAAILAWERKLYDWLHNPAHADELESWNAAILRKTETVR